MRTLLSIRTLSLVFILILTVYFRTLWIQKPSPLRPQSNESLAVKMVLGSMKEQLKPRIRAANPSLDESEINKLVEKEADAISKLDQTEFESAVQNTLQQIQKIIRTPERPKPYLLEADPYYYYYVAQQIETRGALFSKFKDGLFYNPLRLAPEGSWDWPTLHPYLGILCHRILSSFNEAQDLMASLGWLPVFLSALVACVFYRLCSTMRFSCLPSFLGAFTLMLSPIFLQRSAYGWFDTDPYNYFFPIVVLTTFFEALDERRNAKFYAVGGGFLTGLYSLFWAGWPFLFGLLSVAAGIVFTVEFVRSRKLILTQSLRYLIVYIASSFIFLCVFITPINVYKVIYNGLTFLPKFSVSQFELWPSVFLTVGEAKSITLQKIIFLTGNYGVMAIAVVGALLSGFTFYRERHEMRFKHWITVMVFTAPLLWLSLRTERFSVLFVLPLALLVCYGTEHLQRVISNFPGHFLIKRPKIRQIIAGTVILFAVMPMSLLQGGLVSRRISPIMDPVWYEALTEIKKSTPNESIIYSWWPPGYFIISIANRRAVVDGGTQEKPQSYWLAKAFLADDERQTAGILRMLATSGNSAMSYLEEKGVDVPSAVELILKIAGLSRDRAKSVFDANWSDADREKLLNLTHGKAIAPGYVLMYQDLLDQNLAVTLMSEWDFRKAVIVARKKSVNISRNARNETNGDAYIKKMLDVTGNVLKYWPESDLTHREGSVLYFADGTSINLESKTATILPAAKGVRGKPKNLFLIENGKLSQRKQENPELDVSVLLIDRQGIYACVVADEKLIRSMMFRWYYLNSEGLTLFSPLFRKQDPGRKNQISISQIKWDVFLNETSEIDHE